MKLSQLHHHDPQGNPVTIGEHVIAAVRAGSPMEAAAAAAGLNKTTVYDWLRRGARIATQVHEGQTTTPRVGSLDRQLMDFSNGLAQAEAEWHVGSLATLERLSRPREHTETRTTTENTADGPVVRVVKTTKTLEPDAGTIRWRLAQKYPQLYGRQALELSGPDGGPIPVAVAETAMAKLEQMARNLAANEGALEQARAEAEHAAQHLGDEPDPDAMPS